MTRYHVVTSQAAGKERRGGGGYSPSAAGGSDGKIFLRRLLLRCLTCISRADILRSSRAEKSRAATTNNPSTIAEIKKNSISPPLQGRGRLAEIVKTV